ncbi:cell surface protein [Haloferax mediterranei ATCC 33500]|uniref:Cell surface glycoprotein n=1 Tax=Haloferax mediterranei (strain ATCC 33500 / DSM 1411 / JCM 8866 / NBRC 14739 / NCIMB 2177 / R-4) TaxID=523841 RepID=M0IVF2_HALMT|nr:cell surface glycoprotein [Haloferax mediterranei ATCC 33500]QCQ76540.1 cell surface protein [Haloferax mediterranei ATCC 33500]
MVAAVLLAAVAPPTLGASGNYDIDIDGSIDTVDRTVSTERGDFLVTEVGRADAGDSVGVSVDAPSGAEYSIMIHDADENIRRSISRTGDDSKSFDTDGLEPGTYSVSATNQSTEEVHDVEPLVIRAYRLTVNADDAVENGNDLDVTVELDQVESGEPVETVQVVLANDSKNTRVDASKVNDSNYSASVSTDDFATGDYSLYAVVRTDDKAMGENELVGVSDASTVEVVDQKESETSTPGGGGSGGDPSDGDSSDGDSDSTNKTTTTTSNNSTTPTTTTNNPTTTTTTEGTDHSEPTTTATTTTDNVVTPNESATTTEQPTTSSDVPNTAPQALFGVLVVFAVGRRLVRN